MKCALNSAFFRFFRTKAFLLVLIISLIIGAGIIFDTCTYVISTSVFGRPRAIANDFLAYCIAKLAVVIPVAGAVFCTAFTGSDISYRSINNKISTGIKRVHIYLADYIVTVIALVMSSVINLLLFYAFAKFVPQRSYIKINSMITGLVLKSFIICLAYVSLYLLFQYFISRKMLAIIMSLMLIPAVYMGTFLFEGILEEPYRKSVKNEQTEQVEWELNSKYVGGTTREVIDYVYKSSIFYVMDSEDFTCDNSYAVAGSVIALSSALGLVAVNKKEYT